jgi:hypothetical protein
MEGRRCPVWLLSEEPHLLSQSTLPEMAGWRGRRPNSKCNRTILHEIECRQTEFLLSVNFQLCIQNLFFLDFEKIPPLTSIKNWDEYFSSLKEKLNKELDDLKIAVDSSTEY